MAPVQLFLRGIQGNTQAVWACPDQSVLELKGAVEVSVSKPFKSGERTNCCVWSVPSPLPPHPYPQTHKHPHRKRRASLGTAKAWCSRDASCRMSSPCSAMASQRRAPCTSCWRFGVARVASGRCCEAKDATARLPRTSTPVGTCQAGGSDIPP